MHLSMVCPLMGGATDRKFAFFRFSKVNFPTLGSPLWVKFPLLGQTWIGAHNTLFQHSASQVSNFTWWQMVPTNFVHFPKWRRYILARYLAWLAIWLTLLYSNSWKGLRQRGRTVKALGLQFGRPEFKSRPDRLLDLFSVVPTGAPNETVVQNHLN